jgi:trimethylamine--corrinoid protein Co-methyltransferase
MLGGLHGELTYHPALAVLDNDLAGMVGRFLEGIQVDHETLAIELIEQVGPMPGFFLNTAHTRKWWQKENYIPRVFDQSTYPEWIAGGKKGAFERARERVAEMLASYKQPITPEQDQELDRIMEEARKYYRNKGLA